MSVKYHGKYCGPGWSAGKYQQSVNSNVPPTDEFDATCKIHDGAYAQPTNSKARSKADSVFFHQNFGKGPKRTIAALAVKAASKIMRAQEANPTGQRLRGSNVTPTRGPKPNPKPRIPAVSRAAARLNQRRGNTQQGHLINSITNKQLITTPSHTMSRKYKANNTRSKAPVAISKTIRTSKPKLQTRNGQTVITHREYVGAVSASITGNYATKNCNPGISSSFPWLSSIAGGYERYKFNRLEYTFVSAAATSERGRVGLAFQYDPSGEDPSSRSEFFSIVPNVEEAPWEDMVLRVSPIKELRYIRSSPITTGTTNTYDCGKLQVLTAMNADSTTQLGELFVDYSVTLENPQFNQSVVAGSISVVAESAAAPFGTSFTYNGDGKCPLQWITGLTAKVGTTQPLLVSFIYLGTGLAESSPTLTRTSGSAGVLYVKANTVNTASTEQQIVMSINYTQYDDLITLTGSESTTITSLTIRVGEYTNS
jgi:hypothetical protein